MPPRWIPLAFFALAHLSLATAFALLTARPAKLSGFFYHPPMLAVVHLVTLGWVGGSILGALYVIGPLAFRMPWPARGSDYASLAAFAIGASGMVSHFWIDRPPGMAWSAALAGAALIFVAARGLSKLRSARAPLEARLPLGLALANAIAAAVLGVLLGINKNEPFLPIRHLDAVFAHAHLAALGFGTMMVVGAGYRMLPMILPSAMPRGTMALTGPVVLECGIGALVLAFLAGGRGLAPAAVLTIAGLGAFFGQVVWMLRNRRPAPSGLRRPDWSVAHAMSALFWLLVAAGLGLHLALFPASETSLLLTSAYGVFGLVGFLAQIVVGVEGRILPMFAWVWGFADRDYREIPPSLHTAPVRALQASTFFAWNVGVPLLAFGLARETAPAVRAGGAALLYAVIASLANAIVVLARLWRR